MTELAVLFGCRPEAWMADALCAQTDPDAFFPEKGGRTAAVKAVCSACPVTAQCLDYALRYDVRPRGVGQHQRAAAPSYACPHGRREEARRMTAVSHMNPTEESA